MDMPGNRGVKPLGEHAGRQSQTVWDARFGDEWCGGTDDICHGATKQADDSMPGVDGHDLHRTRLLL
jgi:hypothetical protein